MRVWRALKALGTATLRDGVYLLPASPEHATILEAVGQEARAAQGEAEIYRLSGIDETQEAALRSRFDRRPDYAGIEDEAQALLGELKTLDGATAGRRLHALRRRFEQVVRVDFFPGEPQSQTSARLDELREALNRHLSPDEPSPQEIPIPRLDPREYRGRIWATRRRPWVDRLASAWLIRRHIDPEAKIMWLVSPADCRPEWLGFDFDGAAFSHVGTKVTFETLLASFGLETDPALARLGELVHNLDLGGPALAEAAGMEALLSGLRLVETDDDRLLAEASNVFDWLLQHYKEPYRD